MRKGTKTKEYIIQRAAELFNQQGYFGSSISDVMAVTGLRKGGIYNHFENKDELALASFDYAITVLSRRYAEAIKNKKTAYDQLVGIVSIYENIIEDPPLVGGCPLLNTAVESDDAHPALREKAVKALDDFVRLIRIIIQKGKNKGEFKEEIDPQSEAIFITSSIEGSVMISKLYGDSKYMKLSIENMVRYIESFK